MSRTRTIQVSALNITMHSPHSPQLYVDLLRRALNRRKIFKQGEIHALMLGSLTGAASAVEKNELTGEVFRFVKVDAAEPWFNSATLKQATDDDLDDISIPPHLFAHMQRIHFVFLPKEHQLWFASVDGKSRLGSLKAESFFQDLLTDASSSQNGPQVDVTAIPDKSALDDMFALHKLSRITMQFKRPNPDDVGSVAARIKQRMQDQRVATVNEELIAEKGESIKPDATTKVEAAVAAMNGYVEVVGKDELGMTVTDSTVNKPLRIPVKVNPNTETTVAALLRARTSH